MRNDWRIADECQKLVGDLGKERFVLQKLDREAVDRDRLGRHLALRIEIAMKALPSRDPIDELDAADLH